MYNLSQYGHIRLAVFSNEVTLSEIEQFAADISSSVQESHDIFLIALPINMTKYPQQVQQVLKAANLLKKATTSVTRFYGLRQSPIMTFIANIVSNLLGIQSNTVEAPSLEDLFKIIRHEANQFPKLNESIGYLDTIQAEIKSIKANSRPSVSS
jgi:hypothetical protein